MKITTKRLKEIIMEEVKALSENAPEEEIEEGAGKLDDAQIMRDIKTMLKDKTLSLTDEQRNTLETILHHILGGRMGIDDKPSRVEPDPLASLNMDHYGMSTPSFEEGLTKKDLARIIHEETVKAIKEGVVDMDGETVITGPDGDASPLAQAGARQDDLQATMLKAAMEIKNNMPQKAYETLLRALAAAGMDEKYLDDFMGYGDLEEYRSGATGSANNDYRGGADAEQSKKRRDGYRGDSSTSPNRNKYRGGR